MRSPWPRCGRGRRMTAGLAAVRAAVLDSVVGSWLTATVTLANPSRQGH